MYYARKKLHIHDDNLLRFCRILALKWEKERTLKNDDYFQSYLKCKKTLKFRLFLQYLLQNLTKLLHPGFISWRILMAFNSLKEQILSITELKLR